MSERSQQGKHNAGSLGALGHLLSFNFCWQEFPFLHIPIGKEKGLWKKKKGNWILFLKSKLLTGNTVLKGSNRKAVTFHGSKSWTTMASYAWHIWQWEWSRSSPGDELMEGAYRGVGGGLPCHLPGIIWDSGETQGDSGETKTLLDSPKTSTFLSSPLVSQCLCVTGDQDSFL